MSSNTRYVRRPMGVTAIQFGGNLSSYIEIFRLLDQDKPVFVPIGYEHHLRVDSEHDRSNGHLHDHAPAYLVFYGLETESSQTRVDVGSWIVINQFGAIEIYDDQQFRALFNEAE